MRPGRAGSPSKGRSWGNDRGRLIKRRPTSLQGTRSEGETAEKLAAFRRGEEGGEKTLTRQQKTQPSSRLLRFPKTLERRGTGPLVARGVTPQKKRDSTSPERISSSSGTARRRTNGSGKKKESAGRRQGTPSKPFRARWTRRASTERGPSGPKDSLFSPLKGNPCRVKKTETKELLGETVSSKKTTSNKRGRKNLSKKEGNIEMTLCPLTTTRFHRTASWKGAMPSRALYLLYMAGAESMRCRPRETTQPNPVRLGPCRRT